MAVNVVALVKGEEQYAFIYDDGSIPQLLATLGRYAADPELSFEWNDAARLSCAARGKEYKPPEPKPQVVRKWPVWRYLSNLFLLATGILWTFAAIEFFHNHNPGGLVFVCLSIFTVIPGLICAEGT